MRLHELKKAEVLQRTVREEAVVQLPDRVRPAAEV